MIDLDLLNDQSLDQLLEPVGRGFEPLSDDQLDALFHDARNRNAYTDK